MHSRLYAIALQLGLIAVSVEEPTTGEGQFSYVTEALKDKAYEPRHINL